MDDFIMMPVPANMFTAVCALLGGASTGAVIAANKPAPVAAVVEKPAPVVEEAAKPAEPAAAVDTGEVDAEGHPWSADLHASTKTKTKAGVWRMKVGVTRPEPAAGFTKAGDDAPTAEKPASESGKASEPSIPVAAEEDDEFAAFRDAAAASDAKDAGAAAKVSARKWTEADLGKLCNQAATKLGDPAPVKALIAEYVGEGNVAHSRNIPEDKREAFAKAVEAKAAITFEG